MRPLKYLGLFLTIVVMSEAALAQTEPSLETVIDRVAERYDTERLADANTIRFQEDRRQPYFSHDYNSDFHDLARQRRFTVLDLNGERGTSEYLTVIGLNNYHGRSILKEGAEIFIDYGIGNYEGQGEQGFEEAYAGTVRGSDVLLALSLAQNPDAAKLTGREMWLGHWHHLVELDLGNGPTLTLFINEQTGLITRMRRTVAEGRTLNYTYDNHAVQDGVSIAREYSVFSNNEPLFFSFNRTVRLNLREDSKAFEPEKGIVQEPERVDQSQMTVESMGQGAYHVGMGEAYSSLFKTEEGLLLFGTQSGLADRLAAYRSETRDQTALKYVVIADHHEEELSGLSELSEPGVTLLTTDISTSRVTEAVASLETLPKLEAISTSKTIGSLRILNRPTGHALQNLFLFDEVTGALVQSAHYISPYADTGFYAKGTAVGLKAVLDKAGIQPQTVFSTGSRKGETWSDFALAVETYDDTLCFRNRPICDGL